jgi:hypothetical protein
MKMSSLNLSDKRWIYILIFAIITISSIAPVAFPLPIMQWSRDFYSTIDEGAVVDFADPPRNFEGVTEGTRVMILCSGEVDKLWGDMSEAVTVVWKDLKSRGANILLWTSSPSNEATLNKYLLPLMYGPRPQDHPDYGVKFVNLGYVAGGNGLLEQWKDSVVAITPNDAYGNNLADLPMMETFDELKAECDLMIGLDARGLETIYVVRFNTPLLEMGGTDSASYLALSYTAGYFKGMLMGQRGGAEYELLSGIPGKSFAYLQNALTIGIVMIALMIVMNVRWYLTKESQVSEGVS